MDDRKLKQYYKKASYIQREICEWTKVGDKIRYKLINSKIPLDNKIVLDIGCGDGELICSIAEKRNKDKFIGVDISENFLKKFKTKADKLDIFQICLDSTEIPLKDSSVDIVICSEVLEHVVNYEKVLKEIFRILTPDGTIIVSVPYEEKSNMFICPYCLKEIKFFGGTVGHVHSFDENKIFYTMNHCGFNIISSQKSPTYVSRKIYKHIKIPLFIINLIDKFFSCLGFYGRWLIMVGKKKE